LAQEENEQNQTDLQIESISPPYSPDEILGTSHMNQIHKRQLQNAESMAKKGNLKSALEIYGRTLQRIKDPEASGKIKEIIELVGNSYKKRETQAPPKQIPTSRGANKLNFSKVLRDLSNVVSELSQNLQNQQDKTPKQSQPPEVTDRQKQELPESSRPPQEPSIQEPPPNISPQQPYPQDMGENFPQSSPPPQLGETSNQPSGIPQGGMGSSPSQGYQQGMDVPPQQFNPQSPVSPGQQPYPSQGMGFPQQIPQGTDAQSQQPSYSPNLAPSEKTSQQAPGSENQNQAPVGFQTPPPPFSPISQPQGQSINYPELPSGAPLPDGILNRLEILEELYNRKDWQDLKDLPLRDRRSGNERRKEDTPVENDRRDQERRNDNLLDKRDEFVSDWNDSIEKGVIPPSPEQDQNKLTSEAPKPTPAESIEKKPANEEFAEGTLPKINLPDPVVISYDSFRDAPKRSMSLDKGEQSLPAEEGLQTRDVLFPTEKDAQVHEIFKINLPNPKDTSVRNRETEDDEDNFVDRDINIIDSPVADEKIEEAMENRPEVSIPEIQTESQEPPEPERIMHGILELKPPEVDDAPFLTLTYDFSKIPHSFRLSKNYSIMEYSYYKYKPMLMKAQEFARRKMLKNALNYYRVVRSQNIPPELKLMINRNITDITEFLEKFIMSKGG
jgi:hypothetical protein